MFRILHKEELAKEVTQIIVEAPQVAKKAQAGQFVAVVIDEQGERIPLTLADWDKTEGTITLIFQKVGFTTKKLGVLNVGDSIQHILGPLGHPTEVKNFGTVICIGGGVGIAEVYPASRAFKEAGNRVLGIIGARSKELLILKDKMQEICAELFITTDDGSYGRKGLVTDVLKELLDVVEKSTHTKFPDLVYCIGPVRMMQAVAELTGAYKIKTIVSLNPIMVDATGMCGSCRLTVAGKTVFGCVDGPDFDGHQVDFDELEKRLRLFRNEEDKLKGENG
ncbi:MAG: sulfide/dihydroorotate dehydrogenase-like FAD/NAD-binding protein [Candidatus Omnitrophota bacterium]|nr:sulfide/dihydroorotate dehydrogenase-like FAD/NAD-binding protein [Candidatus Omnitrophota bacterium]